MHDPFSNEYIKQLLASDSIFLSAAKHQPQLVDSSPASALLSALSTSSDSFRLRADDVFSAGNRLGLGSAVLDLVQLGGVAESLINVATPATKLFFDPLLSKSDLCTTAAYVSSLDTSISPYLNKECEFGASLNIASTAARVSSLIDQFVTQSPGPSIDVTALEPWRAAASGYLVSAALAADYEVRIGGLPRSGSVLSQFEGTFQSSAGEFARELYGGLREMTVNARLDPENLGMGSSAASLLIPGSELYTATQLARSLSFPAADPPVRVEHVEEEIDRHNEEFEERLTRVDGQLIALYRGAVVAIERRAPDWQRHAMSSMRELLTQLLHRLTPMDQVEGQAREGDIDGGRPTRSFRLRLIFGPVGGPSLSAFMDADMKAALRLFDLLNKGTHALDSGVNDKQVRYIRARVVGLAAAMIDAADATRRGES